MEHSEKILKTLKVLNNHIVKMIDGDISDRTSAQYDFAEEIVKLFSLPDVINWVFFPEIPNIGDEIVLVYPPEQMMEPMIAIYDRNIEWIDGCKWALITPYL